MPPRVAGFNGIEISIYAGDHNPPHVHVYYGDDAALVEIETGAVLRGHVGGRVLRQAQAWIAAHAEELLRRWAELNP